MRKFLMIIGAVSLFVIVVAGAGIGVIAYEGRSLDQESRAYVDIAVPAIAAGWDKRQLLDRSTPEMRAQATPENIRVLFDWVARLGPYVSYDGATGEATMSFNPGPAGVFSALYMARVRFRDGTAAIRIVLTKRDGVWMIAGFHVEPSLTSGAFRDRNS